MKTETFLIIAAVGIAIYYVWNKQRNSNADLPNQQGVTAPPSQSGGAPTERQAVMYDQYLNIATRRGRSLVN